MPNLHKQLQVPLPVGYLPHGSTFDVQSSSGHLNINKQDLISVQCHQDSVASWNIDAQCPASIQSLRNSDSAHLPTFVASQLYSDDERLPASIPRLDTVIPLPNSVQPPPAPVVRLLDMDMKVPLSYRLQGLEPPTIEWKTPPSGSRQHMETQTRSSEKEIGILGSPSQSLLSSRSSQSSSQQTTTPQTLKSTSSTVPQTRPSKMSLRSGFLPIPSQSCPNRHCALSASRQPRLLNFRSTSSYSELLPTPPSKSSSNLGPPTCTYHPWTYMAVRRPPLLNIPLASSIYHQISEQPKTSQKRLSSAAFNGHSMMTDGAPLSTLSQPHEQSLNSRRLKRPPKVQQPASWPTAKKPVVVDYNNEWPLTITQSVDRQLIMLPPQDEVLNNASRVKTFSTTQSTESSVRSSLVRLHTSSQPLMQSWNSTDTGLFIGRISVILFIFIEILYHLRHFLGKSALQILPSHHPCLAVCVCVYFIFCINVCS